MKAVIVGNIHGLKVYYANIGVGTVVTPKKEKATVLEYGFAILTAYNLNEVKFGGSIDWKAEECC